MTSDPTAASAAAPKRSDRAKGHQRPFALPVLQGVLPVVRSQIAGNVLAGVTLAALLGAQGYYPVPRDVLDAYRHQPDPAAPSPQPVTGQPPASTSLPGRVTP